MRRTRSGRVARDIDKVVAKYRKLVLPRATQITVRGQVKSMRESFTGLGLGMIFAVLLVYLLMVVNFQSWLDPFIILTALPGAACGILWMLFLTRHDLQRAVADGSDHDGRRGDGELHPDGDVCQRSAQRWA